MNDVLAPMRPVLLERAFETDASIVRHNLLQNDLAPTYPVSWAETLRVNGIVGLKRELGTASYRLQLVGMRNAQTHPKYTSGL